MPPPVRVISRPSDQRQPGRSADGRPYRDYQLRSRRQGRWRRWIGTGAVLLVVAGAGIFTARALGDYRTLGKSLDLARDGRLKEAEAGLLGLTGDRWFGAAARDGLGIVALLGGDVAEARRRFAAAGPAPSRWLKVDHERMLLDLLDDGDYTRAEVLAAHARSRGDTPLLRMYHGIALNGLDAIGPAREALAGGTLRGVFERVRRGDNLLVGGVFRDEKVLKLYASHVKALVDKERTGRRAYLYDGAGKPLFRVSVKTGEPALGDEAMRALVFGSGSAPGGDAGGERKTGGIERLLDGRDRRNRVDTTIDPEVQRAAFAALRNYRGAVVVLAPDGSVLAAAARDARRLRRDRAGESPAREPPDPFTTLFDLASVAKVPTLVAAYATPGAIEAVFPFACRGRTVLGGKPFYDSRTHGAVADPAVALAVSCNLAFAELGRRAGKERLGATFAGFGFGAAPSDPLAPGPMGKIESRLDAEREIAELAAGFKLARATTAGAAAIALAIATGGEYREPWIFRSKATLAGTVYARSAAPRRRVASAEVAAAVRAAMVAVVTSEEGTGRRARSEGLTLAAKTGTSGGGKEGFDVVFAGFAPAESPRYAFAFFLQGGERAEWDGAFAAKALLDGLQALEEERKRAAVHAW